MGLGISGWIRESPYPYVIIEVKKTKGADCR